CSSAFVQAICSSDIWLLQGDYSIRKVECGDREAQAPPVYLRADEVSWAVDRRADMGKGDDMVADRYSF
ncbi:MAG: hypothetical protein ACJ8CG_02485, partial [Microvirga sp.]